MSMKRGRAAINFLKKGESPYKKQKLTRQIVEDAFDKTAAETYARKMHRPAPAIKFARSMSEAFPDVVPLTWQERQAIEAQQLKEMERRKNQKQFIDEDYIALGGWAEAKGIEFDEDGYMVFDGKANEKKKAITEELALQILRKKEEAQKRLQNWKARQGVAQRAIQEKIQEQKMNAFKRLRAKVIRAKKPIPHSVFDKNRKEWKTVMLRWNGKDVVDKYGKIWFKLK
jgi:hypothetical protein